VCTGCGIKRGVSEAESIRFQIDEGTPVMYANALSSEEKSKRKRENTLCLKCSGIGYAGRIGVYELLEVNRDIQIAIAENKPLEEIENIAVNINNMLTLRKYGLELIKDGLTTFSELERILVKE
jgi:type IV pilus assembly protein PilB